MSARAGVLPRRRRARHDRFTPDMGRSSRRGDRFARRSRLYSPTPAGRDHGCDDCRLYHDGRRSWRDRSGNDCSLRDGCAYDSGSSDSCWSERHVQPPTAAGAWSASIEAMIAWIGMRPFAINWPPERRAADANGEAHRFSQMSTPAVLPGSFPARCSTSSSAKPAKLRPRSSREVELRIRKAVDPRNRLHPW